MTTTDKDYQVKGVFNKMKQAVHYYSTMESKVLQATNTEAWGAPSSLMRSLAEGTMETEKLDIIMPALYRRLLVKDTRQWLQVYKALVLLEYLIKYGDNNVLAFVQSHSDVLVTLQSFEFIDEKGQDKGYNVRVRSKTVNELVKDPEEIKRIRENGRLSQDRFIGVSSNDMVTQPTMEMNEETPDVIMTAKELPPIQPPTTTTTTTTITTPTATATATVSPPQQVQVQEQQDDMDDAIFREDFIDPLDEDNHAMVFPAAGGKGKKGKLAMDDTFSDDENAIPTDKKKKKTEKTEKKEQQQKKKSRFSLSGVFSRSKQPAKTDTPTLDQSQENAAPTCVENETIDKTMTTTTTTEELSVKVMPMDTVDDDGWGDFASPDQGTDILEQMKVPEQKEDDLLDLDCDIMTTSSARTSVDNNDLLLLDMNMSSYNNSYSQYSAHTTALPPMMNNILPSTNSPSTMMMNNYTANTPTTPFDFDPLGYAPTTPPPAPVPQQLTQHWYPWMATNNTLQQKQQQRPMTVDDLLS